MLRKRWTVGDRNAFFVERVWDETFRHTRADHVVRHIDTANDADCTILAKDLDPAFVGVIAAECLYWEEHYVSVWKVVRDEG